MEIMRTRSERARPPHSAQCSHGGLSMFSVAVSTMVMFLDACRQLGLGAHSEGHTIYTNKTGKFKPVDSNYPTI